MPKLKDRLPKYRRHHCSGQAIVTLDGVDHYLGPHGSQTSICEYDRLIAEWLGNGRHMPVAQEKQPQLTVNHIILPFWEHVQGYYRKPDGTPTSEVDNFKQGLRLLRRLYGHTPVLEFGPLALKAVRQEMIHLGWCRRSINKQTSRICRVFRWAASEQKLPASIYEQLKSIPSLRRGRTTAKDMPRVRPVPEPMIEAVKLFVSRQVWALIRLQLLTGAREGELLPLRGVDLHTRDKIWTHQPEDHKTAYRDIRKTIYFGPRAQAILQTFLDGRPTNQPLFSPAEAEAERRQRMYAARKTPLSYGNRPGTHRTVDPMRKAGDCYDGNSYRRAIQRACEQAFPPPEHLAHQKVMGSLGTRWETDTELKIRLGEERWRELRTWQRSHRWHPHRLRHNAGTHIREEFGVEMASVILGHSSIPMTELYAEINETKAKEVIKKIG